MRKSTGTVVSKTSLPYESFDNIECSHPRCRHRPQDRYTFPIPLCPRHLVQVLARSIEVSKEAKRDHVVKNQAPLPVMHSDDGQVTRIGTHEPVIYYLRFGDRIKIGYTTNLKARLNSLPYDEILGLEPGTRDDERCRHEQYASERITGEWFYPSKRLLAHVATLKSMEPLTQTP